jgi:hypothetical protein
MVLSEYLRFCFPSLQRRVRRWRTLGSRGAPVLAICLAFRPPEVLSPSYVAQRNMVGQLALPQCFWRCRSASEKIMNEKTKAGERHGMFAAKTAAPGFNPKDVWRYGGWLLPNTNIVPSVKDEKAALESGAVKFDLDLKGVMQIERKSSDRHAEARMTDFLKKFPPPETLDLKFRSYGVDEEAAKLMKEVGPIG